MMAIRTVARCSERWRVRVPSRPILGLLAIAAVTALAAPTPALAAAKPEPPAETSLGWKAPKKDPRGCDGGKRLVRKRTYSRCGGPIEVPGCADDARYRGGVHPGGEWRWYGRDYANTRMQADESGIGAAKAAELAPIWTFSSAKAGGEGDFTGTPVVADGCVFAASNRGWVFAINAETGELAWSAEVPRGGTVNGTVAVPGDGRVYVPVSSPPPTSDAGTCESGDAAAKGCVGPYYVALNERNGKLVWESPGLEEAVGADIYASPMVADLTKRRRDPILFSGISGWGAESGGLTPGSDQAIRYAFDGSFVVLDARTGSLLRKTYTIADDPSDQHAGCGIWSTPAIDRRARVAYVGTSNPFRPQTEHHHCNALLKIGLNRNRPEQLGTILGSYKATNEEYVSEFLAGYPCVGTGISPTPSQDLGTCPDMDLSVGASPNLFRDSEGRQLVGVGQKSGVYHVADAGTMERVWTQVLGAPTLIGGIVGSTAYDGRAIYGPNTAPGYMWSTRKDDGAIRWMGPHLPGYGNPTSVANGVAYTSDQGGILSGYTTRDGEQVLSHSLPAGSQGGVSIARNTVFAAVGETTRPEGFIVALQPGGRPGGEDPGGEDPPPGDPPPGDPPPGDPPPDQPPSEGGPVTSTIVAGPTNSYYTSTVAASRSGSLEFLNLDSNQHDVVSRAAGPDGAPLFRTPLIGNGQRARVEGTGRLTPGETYEFFCTIHPSMTGEVVATP
jgi:polyvinyl alcohol dehydrogenase (cytochrome)